MMKLYGIPGEKIDERSIFFYELWGFHSIVTALWFFAPRLGFRNNALLVMLASAANNLRCAVTRGGSFADLRNTFLLQGAGNLVVAALIAKDWLNVVKFETIIKVNAALVTLACITSALMPKTALTRTYGAAPLESPRSSEAHANLLPSPFHTQESKSRRISMHGGFGPPCSL
jgi:hypothetical protein